MEKIRKFRWPQLKICTRNSGVDNEEQKKVLGSFWETSLEGAIALEDLLKKKFGKLCTRYYGKFETRTRYLHIGVHRILVLQFSVHRF